MTRLSGSDFEIYSFVCARAQSQALRSIPQVLWSPAWPAAPDYASTLLLVLPAGQAACAKVSTPSMQQGRQTPAAHSEPHSLPPVGALWADDAPPEGSPLWAAACSCLEFEAAELLELLRGQLPVTEVKVALQQQPG